MRQEWVEGVQSFGDIVKLKQVEMLFEHTSGVFLPGEPQGKVLREIFEIKSDS